MTRKWILTERQRCDLEMLMNGAFHPLQGFQSQADYENILSDLRLANGSPWPIPITLDVNHDFATQININDTIQLYDADNTLLAYMQVTDKWQPHKAKEAECIFNTTDCTHPGVNYLMNKAGSWYLGGPLTKVADPKHFDFLEYRHTPQLLKTIFASLGYTRIVAFQTRNPLHRAHMELTLKAAEAVDGHILIHPVVGMTKPGDIDYLTRVQCYQKILKYYPPNKVYLSLLPLAMRMAGPREALWHALIRKNYGCTHFIIGRDHAGPGVNQTGKPFYDPYAAQKLVMQYQDEIGIKILPFQEMVYVKERKTYESVDAVKPNETALTISGTELRLALQKNLPIPEWFSFPDIIETLRAAAIPKHKMGLTLFLTGLSGAGKSVLSQALYQKLKSLNFRNVTVLDSDITRRILGNDLGFSKKDRDLNIRRIGYVASEITKVGGIAICAAIAPYTAVRDENRELISQFGHYIEIYVATSFNECAKRDTKGLYAKAIKGELPSFTGYNDPYEPPLNPELTIDTATLTVDDSVKMIMDFLIQHGYIVLQKTVATDEVIA